MGPRRAMDAMAMWVLLRHHRFLPLTPLGELFCNQRAFGFENTRIMNKLSLILGNVNPTFFTQAFANKRTYERPKRVKTASKVFGCSFRTRALLTQYLRRAKVRTGDQTPRIPQEMQQSYGPLNSKAPRPFRSWPMLHHHTHHLRSDHQ